MAERSIKVILSAVDRLTAPLRRITGSFKPLMDAVRKLGQGFDTFKSAKLVAALERVKKAAGETADRLQSLAHRVSTFSAAALAGVVAGGTAGLAQVVKINAQFERYGVTLETVLGSAEKAKAALSWVSDFAAKTPYEIDEVTNAFVKLQSYGIDGMKGSLENAGNAAAILGKPLMQAVEALADAMTGENERLKEFGIVADASGKKIQYNWVENGKQMTAFAEKNSRQQMLAVINGIWNRQYKGGMDKLSNTWTGMWSNIQDAYSRFMLEIGQAGLFDWLKAQLKEVLDSVNELQKNGTLTRWATNISRVIVDLLKRFKAFVTEMDWESVGQKAWRVLDILDRMSALVGGPLYAGMIALGAIAFGPLLTSLMILGATVLPLLIRSLPLVAGGIKAITLAMATNPIGAVITGLIALVAMGVYVGRNWNWFKEQWIEIWAKVESSFTGAWDRIKAAYAGTWADLTGAFKSGWLALGAMWSDTWDALTKTTKDKFESIVEWLSKYDMFAVGRAIVQGIWDGMKDRWDDVKKWFASKIKGLFNFWNKDDDTISGGSGSSHLPGGMGSDSLGGGGGSGGGGSRAFGGGVTPGGGGGGATTPGGGSGGSTGGGDGSANTGEARPSGDVQRGSANYMKGQHGGVGQNQTTITTASGKRVTVHRDAAASFKGFLDELEGSGYKINSLGGLAIRNKRGGSSWSQHAYGNAIDVNPAQNPFSREFKTDLPKNISDMAAKHGLSWGGDWNKNGRGKFDTMHFEWTGRSPAEKAKAAELQAKDQAEVEKMAAKHPFPKMADYIRSQQGGDGTDLRGGKGGTPGLNNNNFGNLKFNPRTWNTYPGAVGPSKNTDEGTPQLVFKSLEDGIAGAHKLMMKFAGQGKDTVNKMVSERGGWTPGKQFASNSIARLMGVGTDQKLDFNDPSTQKNFLRSMGIQEHGAAGRERAGLVDGVVDRLNRGPAAPKKLEAPAAGTDTFKKAGEQSLTRSATTNYSPSFTINGTGDKELPKTIDKTLRSHSKDLEQRQREALHD